MASDFLGQLSRRVLVFDGAMGTSIFARNLSVEHDYCGCENCTDILVRTRPDVIQEIHESFLEAGSDCVETDSFGASRHVLAEFGLADECYALNKRAGEVARAACDRHSTADRPRFAVGSMGPGTKLLTLGNITWEEMHASYREQARGLLAGGVDAFIVETCQDLLQVKCAINAVLDALGEAGKTPEQVPILASVTVETNGTLLLGSEIAAVAHALASYPIVSLGLNCATGPVEMTEHVRWLGRHWPAMGARRGRAISVMPNAGLPVLVEGRTEFPLAPAAFAESMVRFVEESGVGIVGGCCGTTPAHIRELVACLTAGGLIEKGRHGPAVEVVVPRAAVTSLYSAQEYRQDTSILIVGERMNASGSRAFKKLLEADDFDGIVSLSREQVRHDGAHVLDINVDYAGRDNARDMGEIVSRVVRQVNAPLMLDSTQIATLEAGLKRAGGKCIINSANFEEGEHRFDAICALAKRYGAGLVIGSIDEDKEASMARTADRKLAIATRGYHRAVEVHGLAPEDLLFDPLVLPISTGMESDRRSAIETIEGVRRIMQAFPRSQTTVGLSNCSFGLHPRARVVLNSVFLHLLQEAGLTSAILHFSKILPRNRIPGEQWAAASDLIHDSRDQGHDPLSRFIGLFTDDGVQAPAPKRAVTQTLEERLRSHIVDGEKEGLSRTIEEALKTYPPLAIINDHLLDGMKTVGELFGAGQMQLPFVLQSAEVMKMAVSQLEPLMQRVGGREKGTIVLATVKGDVHDIGKNLVDIILSNNGYKVVNLGIKQPLSEMVAAWKTHQADAIGMSGLLVKSVNVMEENLKEMSAQGVHVPVILGGAALTRHYCEGQLRGAYAGEVFYGKDAFEGLRTMDHIVNKTTPQLAREIDERTGKRTRAEEVIVKSRAEKLARPDRIERGDAGARSDVATDNPVPVPPFWGTRVAEGFDPADVYPYINTVALFRGQWQLKKGATSEQDYDAMIEDEILPLFEELKAKCRREGLLRPAVVYGYFPCNSEGNDLIIWDPDEFRTGETGGSAEGGRRLREIERFVFPRQDDKRRLCISDFFRPLSSGEVDVVGMHCVTVGQKAAEASQALFRENRYTDYLYLHGLSVETAEALAELWHKRMRQELGFGVEDSSRVRDLFTQKYRGSRYSFGYPACPDLSDQEKLFALLRPERIGCTLTENWQINPEQSTSAIIVHHPEAKYFNV